MSDASSTLILAGDHPAALWLAPALARRGWQVLWADCSSATGPSGAEGWWALSHRIFDWFGEPEPAWPLELCAMPLDGLARFRQGQLLELMPWPGALLDSTAWRRELEVELRALEISRADRSRLQPAQARLHDWQAAWCLEIDFCRSCSNRGHRSGMLAAAMPGGLLETYETDQGALSLASFGAGTVIWSYRPFDGVFDQRGLVAQLKDVFPRLRSPLNDSGAILTGCGCLPRIALEGQSIRIVLPRPSLDPADLVSAAIGWMTAQALLRWLSEDLLRLDRLGQDLDAYLAKLIQGLASFRNSYTFLAIPF